MGAVLLPLTPKDARGTKWMDPTPRETRAKSPCRANGVQGREVTPLYRSGLWVGYLREGRVRILWRGGKTGTLHAMVPYGFGWMRYEAGD